MTRHPGFCRVCAWLCAVIFLLCLPSREALAQGTKRAAHAYRAKSPIRIAVLPFRNALARDAAAAGAPSALGDGIADSLTNALKSVAKLAVTDSDTVLKASGELSGVDVSASDADAERVARSLSIQIVVAGSFQLHPDLLHIDARILTFGDKPQAARTVSIDAKYPDAYAELLNKLAKTIVGKLRIPISRLEKESLQSVLSSISSREAYGFYARGEEERMRGTSDSLARAIDLFNEALKKDPGYALALAAKAQAEVQLLELKRARGDPTGALGQEALASARAAVQASPRLGRGHLAEAAAHMALGDPQSAAAAATLAKKAWPSNGRLYLELAKAMGNGRLTRNADTDRAFLLQPSLALLFPELPKVSIVNNTDHPWTLSFTPGDGAAYPAISVPAHSSRIAPLFAGSFGVTIDGEMGRLENQHTFEAGKDYKLELSGASLPIASFVFVNGGKATMRIQLSGRTKKAFRLPPLGKKEVEVLAGSYTATARIPGAQRSDQYELSSGQQERVEYHYSGTVFNPARVIVENDGNATFTLSMKGKKSYSFRIPPGGRSFTLPAGEYQVRASCGGQSAEAEDLELEPNSEATIGAFACRVVYGY